MRVPRQLVATLLAAVLILTLPALCLHAATMPSGPSATCTSPMPMAPSDPATHSPRPTPHTCCTARPQAAALAPLPGFTPTLLAARLPAAPLPVSNSRTTDQLFRSIFSPPPRSATPLRI